MSIIHKETQWTILKKTIPQEEVFSTTKSIDNGDDLTVLQIPHHASLQPDTNYVVQCIHVADNGLKSEPGSIDFTPVGSSIQPPVINFPMNNGTHPIGNNLVIQASPFISTPSGMPHTATDWRIGTVNNPESLTKNESSTNLTSYTVASNFFQQNTKYYLFARYKSGETYSGWSTSVTFTTTSVSVSIQTPNITSPTNGSSVVATNTLTLVASAFNCNTPSTTHAASIWQISKDANFGSFVVNETSSSALTSFTVPANTLTDTQAVYYIRVRYRANTTDLSEYSSTISVTVADTSTVPITKPAITSPVANQELPITAFIITSSTYQPNIPAAATHTSSLWQVSPTADFNAATLAYQSDSAVNKVSIQVPSSNLQKGTTYYIRVKHKSGSYSSDWSNTVMAKTTPEAKVLPITLVSPSSGFELNVANPLNIVASAFSGTGGATWASASFMIATDSSMQNIAWSTSVANPPSTTATVPANTLSPNTTYYIQVSYLAANADAPNNVAKTTPSSIRTIAGSTTGTVQTPIVTSPTANQELDATQVNNFIGSAFSATGGLSFTNKHWQIATNSDFTSFVYNQEVPANDNPSLSLAANTLTAGTNYWVRVKYWGSATNGTPTASNFSSPVQFKTKAAVYQIQKPSIHTPPNDSTYSVGDNVNMYATLFNGTAGVTLLQAVWHFADNSGFTGTVAAVTKNDSTYNNYAFTIGSTTTKTYVRVKFQGIVNNNINNVIDSEWSNTFHFIINAATVTITKPTVTVPVAAILTYPEDSITITCSAFACTPTGSDTHQSTTWQMSRTSDFSTIDYQLPAGVGTNLTSWKLLKQVFLDYPSNTTNYYFRCKHNSTGGKSSEMTLSYQSKITLSEVIGLSTPIIVEPAEGYVHAGGKISLKVKTGRTYQEDLTWNNSNSNVTLEWQIGNVGKSLPMYTSGGTGDMLVPTYNSGASPYFTYNGQLDISNLNIPTGPTTLKCRFKKGEETTIWSIPVVITAVSSTAAITTPSIVSPYENSQITPTAAIYFTLSAFSSTNVTHKNSLLQIADNTSYVNPVFNQTISNAPTSITVPAGTLQAGKTYYCKVQYTGTNNTTGEWVSSSWSSNRTITTSAAQQTIDKPGAFSASYSGNDMPPIGIHRIEGTPYSSPSNLPHTATEWEFYTDAALTQKVAGISKTITSATAPNGDLKVYELDVNLKYPDGGTPNTTLLQDKAYWVRYRYISNTVMSPWSNTVTGTPYQGVVKQPVLRMGYFDKVNTLNLTQNNLVVSIANVSRIVFAGEEYWSTYGISFVRAEVEVATTNGGQAFWTNRVESLNALNTSRTFKAAMILDSGTATGDNKVYYCRFRYVGQSSNGQTYYSLWSGTKTLQITP